MSDTKTLRDELIDLLKKHDWYYEFSDDKMYWREGSAQRQRICAILPQVEDGQALFDQYKPKAML